MFLPSFVNIFRQCLSQRSYIELNITMFLVNGKIWTVGYNIVYIQVQYTQC